MIKNAIVWFFILALPLGTTISAWQIKPDHGPDRPAPQMAYIKLELIYEEIAEILKPELGSETTIAAGDVGALGYYTGAPILDTVGLNSPESSAYYPLPAEAYVINYAIPADLILDYLPEFVVFLEVYGRNTLLENRSYMTSYEQYISIPTDIYGSKAMYVYRLLDNEED